MIDRKGGNVLMGRSEGFPSHVIHIPTNKKKKRRKHTVGTYDRSIKILNLETQKAKIVRIPKKEDVISLSDIQRACMRKHVGDEITVDGNHYRIVRIR